MVLSLTGLRFYAAFLVFISHLYLFNYFANLDHGLLATYLREIGWVGVSLFFTLSGFVLFINYRSPERVNTFTVSDFYMARIARVYPVFLLATLLSSLLEWLSPEARPFWLPLFLNLSMIHCFDSYACSAFTVVGWSLSHEFVFYSLFPFLSLMFLGKPLRKLALFLLFYGAYLIVIPFLFPMSFYGQGNFALNRVLEFLLGMVAGYLYLHYSDGIRDWLHRFHLFILGIVATCIILMSLRTLLFSAHPFVNQLGHLWYGLPAFVIILSLALLDKHGRAPSLLRHPWIVWGGEISYSFYLIHHLLMRYTLHIGRIVFHIDLKSLSGLPGFILVIFLFLGTLGCAYLMYRFVEIPSRHWILKTWKMLQSSTYTSRAIKVPADA